MDMAPVNILLISADVFPRARFKRRGLHAKLTLMLSLNWRAASTLLHRKRDSTASHRSGSIPEPETSKAAVGASAKRILTAKGGRCPAEVEIAQLIKESELKSEVRCKEIYTLAHGS